jgi:hypothetical protein
MTARKFAGLVTEGEDVRISSKKRTDAAFRSIATAGVNFRQAGVSRRAQHHSFREAELAAEKS